MLHLEHLYKRLPDDAPIVLCDQDGVLVDFDGALQSQIEARYPDWRPIEPTPDPPPFYTNDLYPDKHTALIWEIANERGFIRNLPLMQPIEDIVGGWSDIMRAGFRIQVCTSPLITPFCAEEKRASLDEHFAPWFGSWVAETAIIIRDKTSVEGAVLLDDKPTIDDSSAAWNHVLFDRACNRHIADKPRVRGWTDPNKVKTIAQAAGVELPRHLR